MLEPPELHSAFREQATEVFEGALVFAWKRYVDAEDYCGLHSYLIGMEVFLPSHLVDDYFLLLELANALQQINRKSYEIHCSQ